MLQLAVTLVNALAICLFELVYMPALDMLSVWSAGLHTKLRLRARGECRLFETAVPIQTVPGYFSSRKLLAFFQISKVAAVLALILFEAFGDSTEALTYENEPGIVFRRGFTIAATYSEGFTRQAEHLEGLCVSNGRVRETLLREGEESRYMCGELAAGMEYALQHNGTRGIASNSETCKRIPFVAFEWDGNETKEVVICDGKVNAVASLYLNFTDDVIEASDMTSDFDGSGGYVTNIRAVRLERRPISSNVTARAIRFFRNWEMLRSVRLALRAELVNASVNSSLEWPQGSMSVETSKRTVYILTPRAMYCLFAIAAALAACFAVGIVLWTMVLWRRVDCPSVASLAKVLQVAVSGDEGGARVHLVANGEYGNALHFEQRRGMKHGKREEAEAERVDER